MNTLQIIQLLSLTTTLLNNIAEQLTNINSLISKVQYEKRGLSDKEINDLNDNLDKAIIRLEKAVKS